MNSSSTFPALDLVQCKDVFGVVNFLQEIQAVPYTAVDELARPDDEPSPVSLVQFELLGIHDRSNLSGGDDLGITGELEKVVVSGRDGLKKQKLVSSNVLLQKHKN